MNHVCLKEDSCHKCINYINTLDRIRRSLNITKPLLYSWMNVYLAHKWKDQFLPKYDEWKCGTPNCKNKVNNISTKSNNKKRCNECNIKHHKERERLRYHRNKKK